jgi:hypothetical protein
VPRHQLYYVHHSLFKYFSERHWADAFLEGQVLFRSLSYFRDYEDQEIRGDRNEGVSIFRPEGGLTINNITQGKTVVLRNHAFESTTNQDEIFVFCASKSLNDELRERFKAIACVEILNIKALCERVKGALPTNANFWGRQVEYYDHTEGGNPRWALPEKIAVSKLRCYAWQREYRLVFCLTDALDFENVKLQLVTDESREISKRAEYPKRTVSLSSLSDICRLHEF